MSGSAPGLAGLVEALKGRRVLVLGDFMLDEFVFGEIDRVSREAPVLILKHQDTTLRGGGAANTVSNLAAVEAVPVPVGFIGSDDTGDRLLELWPDSVPAGGVLQEDRLTTTRKTRILAGSFHSSRQQVVRLDREARFVLGSADEKRIADRLTQLMPECEAVVISDYSLGNLTTYVRHVAITLARDRNLPVVVDSRDDPGGYPGATTVTPNISEVEATLHRRHQPHDEWLESACAPLLREWQVESLLVTRGKLGMSLVEKGAVNHYDAFGSAEAVDVTGAGDTVAAVFTTALAAGADRQAAARLANIAGGLVVMKKGTATVSPAELLEAVGRLGG